MSIVRSITSAIVRPIVSSVFGADSSISRYFLDFDPVLNSYGELGSAWTAAGDFEIELEFATSETVNQILIGDDHAASYYFNFDASKFTVWYAGGSSNFSHIGYTPNDGKLHHIKYKLTGTSMTVTLDGIVLGTATITPYTGANNFLVGSSNSNAARYDGVISSVKLTDIDTPSNSLHFEINEGVNDYELPVNNVLGGELVTNGTFDTDTDWNKGSGVTISGGKMVWASTGSVNSNTLASAVVIGLVYEIKFTISNYSAGFMHVRAGFGDTGTSAVASNGNYTQLAIAGGNDLVYLSGSSSFVGDIDNISVKQVTNALTYNNIPTSNRWLATQVGSDWVGDTELVTNGGFSADTDWTKGTGWTIDTGAGVASCDGTQVGNSNLNQVIGTTVGKAFVVSMAISNYSAGQVRVSTGAYTFSEYYAANGNINVFLTASDPSSNTQVYVQADLNFIGSIDNSSVKRILEQP